MKKHIKGIIIGFLAATLLFSTVVMAAPATVWRKIDVAYGDYKIYINGVLFEATDKNGNIESFSYNGWIYSPFEHIARALGKSVRWDGKTNSLYIEERNATNTAVETVKLVNLRPASTGGRGSGYGYYEPPQREGTTNIETFISDSIEFWLDGDDAIDLDYLLEKKYAKMEALFYLTYVSRNDDRRFVLKVHGDGKLIYESSVLEKYVSPIKINVDLNGITKMKLTVQGVGGDTLADSKVGLGDATLYKYK